MSILNLLKEKTACNVFDNKEEFDETVRIIKKYYKTNFRVWKQIITKQQSFL